MEKHHQKIRRCGLSDRQNVCRRAAEVEAPSSAAAFTGSVAGFPFAEMTRNKSGRRYAAQWDSGGADYKGFRDPRGLDPTAITRSRAGSLRQEDAKGTRDRTAAVTAPAAASSFCIDPFFSKYKSRQSPPTLIKRYQPGSK